MNETGGLGWLSDERREKFFSAYRERHFPILDFARRYLSDRENVGNMLDELEDSPDIFSGLIVEMDGAVEGLQLLLQGEELSAEDRELLPNVALLREQLDGKRLRTISDMEKDPDFLGILRTHRTFREARKRMRRGEEARKGMDVEGKQQWQFHQDVSDPEELAADLLLEMYGVYSEKAIPDIAKAELGGFGVVLALEEILSKQALEGKPTKLFNAFKLWVEEGEGFSKTLEERVKVYLAR